MCYVFDRIHEYVIKYEISWNFIKIIIFQNSMALVGFSQKIPVSSADSLTIITEDSLYFKESSSSVGK